MFDKKLTGLDVEAKVVGVRDGGVWFQPIMGDLLRTWHPLQPQVLAYVNNVPTACKDTQACQFSWSPDLTPIVSSISPQSGQRENINYTSTILH